MHVDLAGPFALLRVKNKQSKGAVGRTKATTSTERQGHAYICLMVDYFTKAAEFAFIADKAAATVARAVPDHWFMRYGIPDWITSDNGAEFAGAFRHLLERFGIDHIHTSARHPQSNGAVERLVRTMKTMLAAKVAGAVHDWPRLLPQLRMEYMQRRHSVTKYSPNELVVAHRLKLPPPVGSQDTTPLVASMTLDFEVAPEPDDNYVRGRDARSEHMVARVYDNILRAQQRNKEQQMRPLEQRQLRRGRRLKLQPGDLAYVLEAASTDVKRNKVSGPFVVEDISGGQVYLRTTQSVPGQDVHRFPKRIEQVARCTTVADVLEKLLYTAGLTIRAPPDCLASQHVS